LKIVTKSFLRYLPRRLSLSLLQLLGVACGVAAVVGMTLSRTADEFLEGGEFLRGKATHSLQRPAEPIVNHFSAAVPGSRRGWFSPVIDRRLRLSNGTSFAFSRLTPFLTRPFVRR
jgi:putative ABC transport system permease protein